MLLNISKNSIWPFHEVSLPGNKTIFLSETILYFCLKLWIISLFISSRLNIFWSIPLYITSILFYLINLFKKQKKHLKNQTNYDSHDILEEFKKNQIADSLKA